MDGQAKDGDRVGWPSRRPLGDGGVSRASDLGHALQRVAGQADRGRPGGADRQGGARAERELRRRVAELEPALGRKTYELEIVPRSRVSR